MEAAILSLRQEPLNIEHNSEVVTGLSRAGAVHGGARMADETDTCHLSPETHIAEEAAGSTKGAAVGRDRAQQGRGRGTRKALQDP